MSAGDLESWWERADYALGMASQVLEHATQRFMADSLDGEGAMAASTLVEAWRELSTTWEDREEIETEEPEPEPVKARRK